MSCAEFGTRALHIMTSLSYMMEELETIGEVTAPLYSVYGSVSRDMMFLVCVLTLEISVILIYFKFWALASWIKTKYFISGENQ